MLSKADKINYILSLVVGELVALSKGEKEYRKAVLLKLVDESSMKCHNFRD